MSPAGMTVALTLVGIGFAAPPAHSQDWKAFRGPRFGEYVDSPLPTRWDAESIAWKTTLPGPGASSPVILGDRIYITCYTGYGVDQRNPGDPSELERHVLCLDSSTGDVLWKKTIGARSGDIQFTQWAVALHGYASSTPAVDETGVYVFFGDAGCVALDPDGNERWTFDCGSKTHMFGSGASPVIYDDLVIINACPESGDLIAINRSSGEQVWRRQGVNESWSTPAIYANSDGDSELAISMEGNVLALKPETGAELWKCAGVSGYVCPSIAVRDGILVATGGKNRKQVMAIRTGGSGDVSESHKLWEMPKGSNVCSPVIQGGHVYWSKENGVVYCVSLETGELAYEERLEPASGLVYASPLLAGGNLYYVSRENGTYVVAAGPEFRLVAHNKIEGDDSVFNACPVPCRGGLLLRSDRYLYLIQGVARDG